MHGNQSSAERSSISLPVSSRAKRQIAHAYVACFEREPSEPLPTAAEVRRLMKKAAACESELAAEGSSWVSVQQVEQAKSLQKIDTLARRLLSRPR